jgi:cell division septal protein FtsQ
LPHTLRIRVTEREPIAQVNMPRARQGGGLEVAVLQLDANGFVMPPLDPRLRTMPLNGLEEQLPVVTGVNALELQPGKRIETAQVLSALRLVQKFQESSMAAVLDLKRVDVTSQEVLVTTTSQGSEITFGLQDFDQQLLRWREIYEQGLRYNKAIASLDLAVTNNTPARWVEASLQPQPPVPPRKAPKPARTSSTTRRRNV